MRRQEGLEMSQESSNSARSRTRTAGSRVRARLAIVIGIVLLSVWSIYPPAERIKRGIDLEGGVQLVLRVDTERAVQLEAQRAPDRPLTPAAIERIRTDTVQQALQIIERRVNAMGVSEPVVARYTQADQILVQLPGVADVESARRLIK